MVQHAIRAAAALSPQKILIVTPPHSEAIQQAVAPQRCVVQVKPQGTGDAAKAAAQELEGFDGDVIVMFGDTPLVTSAALESLRTRRTETNAAIVVAGFRTTEPGAYGRLILDGQGHLTAIVEAAEATLLQLQLDLCNGGIMLFAPGKLLPLLDRLRDDNSKKEFYLTDCIALAQQDGGICVVAEMPAETVLGINTRVELAEAERLMQQRLRQQMMLDGVTMIDPDTVYLSFDTKIGRDVTIGPNVVIGAGVEIGDKVDIRAFCHLEQVRVEDNAIIGPFARLRPGSVIHSGAHIGNFVEIKNAEVGKGAKINHLSYIGDAFVGDAANIGAGTITCNYDGFRKFHTHIGAGAFVGSNSSLVAPVKVGDGAYVGAGSVITMEVPAHTLAVARGRQSLIEDWAKRFREGQIKK